MSINDISRKGPDDVALDDAFRQAKLRVNSVTSPWEFCCNWYREEEIAANIAKRGRFGSDQTPIPADVHSPEFAAWLTNEYRLAMNKGIEIGRRWV